MTRALGNSSVAYARPRRLPDGSRLLILGTVLVGGTVTIPQRVDVGVSGLGVLTVVTCLAAWGLWLSRPWLPRHLGSLVLPLALFVGYSAGSLLWYEPTQQGMQNLAVTAGFFGVLLVTARHVERSPELAASVYRALDVATLFSAVVYAASVPLYGMGAESFILARPFALFAMIGVARQLALWQAGDRWAFVRAGLLVGVIFFSVSRTALVASLFLFPIAALVRGGRRGLLTAAVMAVLAVAALLAAVFLSETMYERFFGYDATMEVGGVTINASGRRVMWDFLIDASRDDLLLGHGAGASSVLVERTFVNLGHPHNDFLRFLYDFGMVGLGIWVWFLAVLAWSLYRRCLRIVHVAPRELPVALTPLLALLAVTASMFTDNSVGYSFIMLPMGVLIGCAVGIPEGEHAPRGR